MSNLHRIQWIDDQIRRGRYPNCAAIAERFEITLRQASRDIEYLRYSLQAPVEYDARHRGYYYVDGDFILPRERLSPEDALLLQNLTESYRRMGSTNSLKIADLFSKIYHGDVQEVRHSAAPIREDEIRILLEISLHEGRDLYISYLDAGNARSERLIRPMKLVQRWSHEYLEAWCLVRNASRLFRLDRILQARPGSADEVQALRSRTAGREADPEPQSDVAVEVITLEDEADRGLGIEPYTAHVVLGDAGQRRLCLRFYHSRQLFSWLLSTSTRFEICSPAWLRRRAAETWKNLARIHED